MDNKYNEIPSNSIKNMVAAIIIIPLTIVVIAGIVGYLLYRFVINDFVCNRAVNSTLREYKIKKTQFQIIKEYHENKGEKISEKEIIHLQNVTGNTNQNNFLQCMMQ